MPVADVYRASINTKVNGVNCLNVLHFFQVDADAGEVPADSLKAALETIILPLWVPMLSNDAEITSVILRRILPTPDQPFSYIFAGGTGTVAQEAEPPNLAVINTHYTTTVSRRGRGRTYFAGVAQTLITNAAVKAALVALFATFETALRTDFKDAASNIHWRWVHFSPTDNTATNINHTELRMQLRVIRARIGN